MMRHSPVLRYLVARQGAATLDRMGPNRVIDALTKWLILVPLTIAFIGAAGLVLFVGGVVLTILVKHLI